MADNLIICPRCNGKTFIDFDDITRLKREKYWKVGKCGYCLGNGKVDADFVKENHPGSFFVIQYTIEEKEEDERIKQNIKQDLPKEILKIIDSEIFSTEKFSFQYGNYPYLFQIADKEKIVTYLDLHSLNRNEYLFALCLNYDGDDHYHLIYDYVKKGYYLKNGHRNYKSEDRLKYPIKIGTKLNDIFFDKKIEDQLINVNDATYYNFQENSYYEYEINEIIPSLFNPQKDMRILFQKLSPESYFTDHKEFSIGEFKNFCNKTGLNNYCNIDTFFDSKPYTSDFMKIINDANIGIGEKRFLFVTFYQSDFKAIIDTKNMKEQDIAILLKYGIIYNKLDVSEDIYRLLN